MFILAFHRQCEISVLCLQLKSSNRFSADFCIESDKNLKKFLYTCESLNNEFLLLQKSDCTLLIFCTNLSTGIYNQNIDDMPLKIPVVDGEFSKLFSKLIITAIDMMTNFF